ncbi:MAG: hypothetical protein KGN02_14265 [bacterium]|nr:hypothetical protein [bacterium]
METIELNQAAIVAHMAAATGGTIRVKNTGAYVATFKVQYSLKGTRYTIESGNFTAGTTRALDVPAGATDIYLEVSEYVFIGITTVIFTKRYDSPGNYCFEIGGTTFSPSWKEVAC